MSVRNRTSNTIRNTSVAVVCQCVRLVFSFLCRMVFARTLAMVYLGVDGVFANVIGILSLAELGMGSALEFELFQAVAKGDDTEIASMTKYYKKIFTLISVAILGIGLAVMPLVDLFIKHDGSINGVSESVILLYVLYLINTVVSYFNLDKKAIICAYQDNYLDSLAKETVTIVQNLIQCAILIFTHNFLLYLVCQVIFTIIYNIVIKIIVDRKYPNIIVHNPPPVSADKKARMLVNVKALFIVRISGALVSATDNLIVTKLCGLEITGINSNYATIMSALNNFAYRFRESLTPSLGNLNAVESDERKTDIFYELMFFYFWVYMLFGGAFILMSQDMVELFFGSRYLIDYPVVVITGINFFITQMQVLPDMYKSTLGLFRYGRFVALATGVLNIILSIAFGKIWGVFGILFATFVAKLLTEIWYTPYIVFKKGLSIMPFTYYKRTLLLWLEAAFIWTLGYCVCSLVKLPIFFDLIFRFVVSMTIPNVVVWIFHHKSDSYLSFTNRVKSFAGRLIKR